MWIVIVAVVGGMVLGVGRWRIVVEWRGAVRVWMRGSRVGLSAGMAAKL